MGGAGVLIDALLRPRSCSLGSAPLLHVSAVQDEEQDHRKGHNCADNDADLHGCHVMTFLGLVEFARSVELSCFLLVAGVPGRHAD